MTLNLEVQAVLGTRSVKEVLGVTLAGHLLWAKHDGVAMKGFPGKFTLWAVNS